MTVYKGRCFLAAAPERKKRREAPRGIFDEQRHLCDLVTERSGGMW